MLCLSYGIPGEAAVSAGCVMMPHIPVPIPKVAVQRNNIIPADCNGRATGHGTLRQQTDPGPATTRIVNIHVA